MQCLLLGMLCICGKRLEASCELAAPSLSNWPRLGLIVPAGGNSPLCESAFRSLLNQDYPEAYLMVIATATANEPLVECIQKLQAKYPQLHHVVAGQTEICGQKNFNTLAAVNYLQDKCDVLVFCDSTHFAERDFLRRLVAPVATGEAAFSTGYHQVKALDSKIVTLSYTFCVQLMRCLQGFSKKSVQLWGGAMSMPVKIFQDYHVKELWQTNVVDDCSLSAYLQKNGIPMRLCPDAILKTVSKNHSLQTWQAWLDRQILFLKFCIPLQWLLLGLLIPLMLLPPLLFLLCLIAMFTGSLMPATIVPLLMWLTMLIAILRGWFGVLELEVPPHKCLQIFTACAFNFSLAYLKTIWASGILWQNIWYEVGKHGKVKSITRLAKTDEIKEQINKK